MLRMVLIFTDSCWWLLPLYAIYFSTLIQSSTKNCTQYLCTDIFTMDKFSLNNDDEKVSSDLPEDFFFNVFPTFLSWIFGADALCLWAWSSLLTIGLHSTNSKSQNHLYTHRTPPHKSHSRQWISSCHIKS